MMGKVCDPWMRTKRVVSRKSNCGLVVCRCALNKETHAVPVQCGAYVNGQGRELSSVVGLSVQAEHRGETSKAPRKAFSTTKIRRWHSALSSHLYHFGFLDNCPGNIFRFRAEESHQILGNGLIMFTVKYYSSFHSSVHCPMKIGRKR